MVKKSCEVYNLAKKTVETCVSGPVTLFCYTFDLVGGAVSLLDRLVVCEAQPAPSQHHRHNLDTSFSQLYI